MLIFSAPLFELPVEMSGTRDRKKVQRLSEVIATPQTKDDTVNIPKGKGTPLGDIFSVNKELTKSQPDNLKIVHKLCFNRVGKATLLRKNLRKFCGFEFAENSTEYNKKLDQILKYVTHHDAQPWEFAYVLFSLGWRRDTLAPSAKYSD
jgi:hypothetical protein